MLGHEAIDMYETITQNPAIMENDKLQFASCLFLVLRGRGKSAPGSHVTMRDITSTIGVKVMEIFQVG
jgi:hypothetical protein